MRDRDSGPLAYDQHDRKREPMSQDKSRDKGRGKTKGKKLAVTKEAEIKDLAPRQDVKGAALRIGDSRISSNHNETLVLDQRFTAPRVQ